MVNNLKFDNSNRLIQLARRLTPLGAQTYSKSYRYYVAGNAPLFIERAKGSKVWDVDGNKFIDFVSALGPVTVGYNNRQVNSSIKNQLKKGISFSLSTKIEVDLAQKLTEIMPGVEMVRFLKNGSDATFAAVKLARAYTGKEIVLTSGYHGMHDWSISVSENNTGVPKNIRENTIEFVYNNKDDIERLFKKYANNIACVILEPIVGNGPDKDYLSFLRQITESNDSILIFDEVVSGFRYALGGAAELYNIAPDLVAFGKGIANGMPLSVVGGKREILELIETKRVFISTTFGGETLSLAAGLETIKILEKTGFGYFWELGNMILSGLQSQLKFYELGDYCSIVGLAPHCGPVFKTNGSVDKYDLMSLFSNELIMNGILSVGILNLSLSHDKRDVMKYLDATDKGFSTVKKYIDSMDKYPYQYKVDPVFRR